VYTEYTYFIILKIKASSYEILYNIGNENNMTTILRLNGKNSYKIFKNIIQSLAKQGAAIPSKISDYEEVYSIREDLGPIVGTYLILVRRAKNVEKWNKFFVALLDEQYLGLAKAFSSFLELAMDLSRSLQKSSNDKRYSLSPVVIDALSIALKRFVDKIIRTY